jgi:hypothetical protein
VDATPAGRVGKGLAAELLGGSDHYCNVIAVQQDERTQGFGEDGCRNLRTPVFDDYNPLSR